MSHSDHDFLNFPVPRLVYCSKGESKKRHSIEVQD